MRRVPMALTALALAGSLLAACAGSSVAKVGDVAGPVSGVLQIRPAPPASAPLAVAGRVCFDLHGGTLSLVVKCVNVGKTGHFMLHLRPGTWGVQGSSPQFMKGKPGACKASDLTVSAGYAGTNVVVECQEPITGET